MRSVGTVLFCVLSPTFMLAQSKAPRVEALKRADTFLCAAMSADGKRLVTGARDGRLVIWDAESRNDLHTISGHKGNVMAVAIAPKAEFFVSAGIDKTVRVWTLEGKEKVRAIGPLKETPTCVAVSTDGKRIAFAGWDGAIHLANADNGETIGEKPAEQGPIFSLAFSPDGKWLASGGRNGTVQIWEAANELKSSGSIANDDRTVWSLAWSPDSTQIAAGGDKLVKVWNAADRKTPIELKGHLAPIRALAFANEGKTLISGSADATVRVWDVGQKKSQTLKGANGPVGGVVSSADGRTIFAVSDEPDQSARVFVLGKE